MSQFHLKVITPQRTLLDEHVSRISCMTESGMITILPKHAALITELVPSELIIHNIDGDVAHNVHVDGGFLRVIPGGNVEILADGAEHFYELNEEQAREAKERAEELLKQPHLSQREYNQALALLRGSVNKIQMIRKHHSRRQSHQNIHITTSY